MNTALDKIFNPGSEEELTEQEHAKAIGELVRAVTSVEKIQASADHLRIMKRIEEKLKEAQNSNSPNA